ncbi:curli production assembly/transport component CsgG domain protein [Leptospira selangorensis]|uniref:CsgG/HfaB family protein n=1 Tax=Leptospira selangorensis TaxID=2484982 RepID=UPI001082B7FF|nr:CsgG/HfaB family protein [Leptospira selangorensis]TGK00477.1 curli production assembly/transport component CsgG domain protein [Leptospira selangorensis]
MRRVPILIFLSAILISFYGNCRSLPSYDVQLSLGKSPSKLKTSKYVVFPFEFAEGLELTDSQENSQKIVSGRNREKAEKALFQAGFTVLERGKLDKLINEITLSKTGITESEGLNLGKIVNANSAVFGKITNYSVARRRLRKHFVAEIILKGVDIETGQILWESTLKGHAPFTNGQQTFLDTENRLYEKFVKKLQENAGNQ